MTKEVYRAYICCGPNCGPKGSGSLLDFLADEVERQGLSDRVSVMPTGCQAHCESGPTMVVYPGPVYYQEVNTDRLKEIIREHFIEGQPVKAYFWTGVRKRILGQQERRAAWVTRQAQSQFPYTKPSERPEQAPKRKREAPPVDDFKW